jgi:hypothetical protein
MDWKAAGVDAGRSGKLARHEMRKTWGMHCEKWCNESEEQVLTREYCNAKNEMI